MMINRQPRYLRSLGERSSSNLHEEMPGSAHEGEIQLENMEASTGSQSCRWWSVLAGKLVLCLNVVVIWAKVALEEAGCAGEQCGSAGRGAAHLPPGESQPRTQDGERVLLFGYLTSPIVSIKVRGKMRIHLIFNNKIPPRS